MSLQLFHDEACTNPIESGDPDTASMSTPQGTNATDETVIYLKNTDSANYYYENVEVSSPGDTDSGMVFGSDEWTVTFAKDDGSGNPDGDGYNDTISFSTPDLSTATPIHRKVEVNDPQSGATNTDITLKVAADQFDQS